MGNVILAAILTSALYYLFFLPLSEEEKNMPDIIEEYIEDDYRTGEDG